MRRTPSPGRARSPWPPRRSSPATTDASVVPRSRPLRIPFQEETYSVSQLCGDVRDFLGGAFPSVWVVGEVNRLRKHRRGHLYFELIEKGRGDEVVGKVEAVVWRNDHLEVRRQLAAEGQEIAEGRQIRCRGGLDFYGPFGRMQLVVREVDPVFSLGDLARRRRETLRALTEAGLVERNGQLALATLPLDVALVTSEGSAAYHDFVATLRESGYGFRVLLLHASVQGAGAERQVASALASLPARGIDCAALVRGGGSRTDLAIFDGRRLAEAVARAPVPVLAGLGHETDETIADLVAHTSLGTPTKVAELLVARARQAEERVERLAAGIRVQATGLAGQAVSRVDGAERRLGQVRYRLAATAGRLGAAARALAGAARRKVVVERRGLETGRERLIEAAGRSFERRRQAPEHLGRRLVAESRAALRERRTALDGWERLCRQIAPERTLERGFAIVRNRRGEIVRRAADLAIDERITTELASGEVTSRVETR